MGFILEDQNKARHSSKTSNAHGDGSFSNIGDIRDSNIDQSKHVHKHFASLIINPSKYKPAKIPKENKKRKRGKIPTGSRLIFPINIDFIGREKDLLIIAGSFFYSPKVKNKHIVLSSGIGGIGKTQLAVEFCFRYGRYFHGIHWLQADHDIESQIAKCGLRMGLQPWPEEQDVQVQITLNAWQERKPRLVVFDNLESPDVLQEWLPKLPDIHILATSRRGRWPSHLGVINLQTKELSPKESGELLVRISPRHSDEHISTINTLSKQLGYHPLALFLAGSYLNDRFDFSIDEFLEELEKKKNLSHPALSTDISEIGPTKHAASIIATFNMSWDRLGDSTEDQVAKELMVAAGYCATNIPIPLSIFYGMNKDVEKEIVDKALCRLYDVGLLQENDQSLPYIHPLVTEYARTMDKKVKNLEKISDVLIDLTKNALDTKLPKQFSPHFEHAEQILHHLKKNKLSKAR